jgi:threonine dehydrogenase-like Zn-dependent dehydrogenase
MRQVLQNLRNGSTEIANVPCPKVRTGQVLIRTTRSLISTGTERMLLDFGRANLVEKTRQQPDKVNQVLDKLRTDGLLATLEAVTAKLDQPLGLGYSNAGRVIQVGRDVQGFAVGDRVASNGKHAEVVSVPANLCARIPDQVSNEQAAFTTLGAIALQGVRLAEPTLGETIVVIGLGLIGLLTVQLLRAQGCRVIGIDSDQTRLELAASFGATVIDCSDDATVVPIALGFSRGRGVDAVIIATSTQSQKPVQQAAQMCRKRGRIVLVGIAGLKFKRDDLYEKELTFRFPVLMARAVTIPVMR